MESGEHDSEHEPVQRMLHVAPSEQLTLPLAPTVMSHVEPPEHSMLHDMPHVPLHWLSSVQPSVQLLPAQPEPSMSQAVPASHVHELPVHVGGGGALLPHADPMARATKRVNPAVSFIARTALQRAGLRTIDASWGNQRRHSLRVYGGCAAA